MLDDRLNEILASVDFPVARRTSAKEAWEDAFLRLPYRPCWYTNANLDYQQAYQQCQGGTWHELSLIAYWNDRPVAIWPLSFSSKDGESRLTSHGFPVMQPLFVEGCPTVTRKRIAKGFLAVADAIAALAKQDTWESGESFCAQLGMSEWHVESMARGATCAVKHEIYLDLTPDMAEIKKGFRKSYKSLISSGGRLWSINLMDSASEAVWERFRKLHFQSAGRVTRSDETWVMQHDEIAAGRAFLVWLENDAGEMVGGGYFAFTDSEGFYSVGAYDRSLFDKPLGHVVQFRAIEECKKRGMRWFKLGLRHYANDIPPPTEKQISIADFKHGFASHVFPQFRLTHSVEVRAGGSGAAAGDLP